jgi:hypothetical protein
LQGAIGWSNWRKLQKDQEMMGELMPKERTKRQPKTTTTDMSVEGPMPPATVALPAEEQAKEDEEKKLFTQWATEEEARESEQWFPCRPSAGNGMQEGELLEDPDRVVLFEDIQDALFQFTCEDIKMELMYRFIEFLGVSNLTYRVSSNDPYRQQRILYMEEVGDIFEVLVAKKASWQNDKPIKEPSLVEFVRYGISQN